MNHEKSTEETGKKPESVDGGILSDWIKRSKIPGCDLDSNGSMLRLNVGFYEHDNETVCSVKAWNILPIK